MATTSYKKPKKVASVMAGKDTQADPVRKWTPMDGVSLTSNDKVKTDGIKIRGTGAATKGIKARGPMA